MGGALALVGSPRRLGNFYLAARHIAWAGGIEELKIIRLQSNNILPCKACYPCLEGKCPLEDDYSFILGERNKALHGNEGRLKKVVSENVKPGEVI